MKKLKIVTILGTRPEIIRLSCLLPKMDKFFQHRIVFSQQSYNYEMSDIFFKEFNLRNPDYKLNVKADTLGKQIANIIIQTEKVLIKERPDAVLIEADTNTALAVIVAKRLRIPIFHFEAGYRAFDWDIPEEVNRRIADHLSDYNLAYTEHARRYLIREGIPQDKIFVVGSPYSEIFEHYKEKIESSDILKKIGVTPQNYFVVSTHREENVDNIKRLKVLFETLNNLAREYKLPIIVTLHPRTKKRINNTKIKLHPKICLYKPFGYFDYNKLQVNACCVFSDSGSVQEESAILDFPAVLIRKTTERPETFDTGSIIISAFDYEAIKNAIAITLTQKEKGEILVRPKDYTDKNVSTKVVKIIAGFTGILKSPSW